MSSLPQILLAMFLAGGAHFAAAARMNVAKNRPVTKVVMLLKEMLGQLEKEADKDEEVYEKLVLWCETNEKEKTKSIEDAKERIRKLMSKTAQLIAVSSRLTSEIENLEKEVDGNQKALEQGTALREKQASEFREEETDLIESIQALKSAIVVLAKHHEGSLLQVPKTRVAGIADMVQYQLRKHDALFKGVLTFSQREAVAAFVQGSNLRENYEPQSGQIFGILKQMLETFETNLDSTQTDEATNQKAYEDLKAAKTEEIRAGQAQLDKKTAEVAEAGDKSAKAQEDSEDTSTALEADEKFFRMLRDKCSNADKEEALRKKDRNAELEAISKAIAILSADQAHDTFSRSFNPAFLQRQASLRSPRRERAASLLQAVGRRLATPKLSAMAVRVKLDAFMRVKKAIDDMVVQLHKDQEVEGKTKDFCVDEFDKNARETAQKEREKEDLTAQVSDLEMTVQELEEALAGLKQENAEMQMQLKRAGEERQKQAQEFQVALADQLEAQKLLQTALSILKQAFGGTPALIQREDPLDDASPPSFSERKGVPSNGAIALIETIIADSKNAEADIRKSEADAKEAYQELVENTMESMDSKSKNMVNKAEAKARAEGEHLQMQESMGETAQELEQLSNYNAQLHGKCDFIVKNFDVRKAARDQEIEALGQAKAILSGADFGETA